MNTPQQEAMIDRGIEYLRRERDELFDILTFAVEMQESVESHRPHSEGSPQNTIAWMDEAKEAIARAKGN